MPFIISKVNKKISKEQEIEIKEYLGASIEYVPGKNEEYLLVGFEDQYQFYLRGKDVPTAYIEVSIFGNEDHIGFDKLSESITEVFHNVLDIPKENIYIKFNDISSWSVNGMFIDRRLFM